MVNFLAVPGLNLMQYIITVQNPTYLRTWEPIRCAGQANLTNPGRVTWLDQICTDCVECTVLESQPPTEEGPVHTVSPYRPCFLHPADEKQHDQKTSENNRILPAFLGGSVEW